MAAILPILLIESDEPRVLRISGIDLMVSLCFDGPESQTRADRERIEDYGDLGFSFYHKLLLMS
jgi:hypothetical protein